MASTLPIETIATSFYDLLDENHKTHDGIKPQVHDLIVVVIKEYRSDRELFNSINLNL